MLIVKRRCALLGEVFCVTSKQCEELIRWCSFLCEGSRSIDITFLCGRPVAKIAWAILFEEASTDLLP